LYAPSFRLVSFETIPHWRKGRVLGGLLNALAEACYAYLEAHPNTPRLYESGVRYEEEPPGRDEWQDIPDTIARRNGDCEDLAAWRIAELWFFKEDPQAAWYITVDELPEAGTGRMVTTYHIQILRSRATEHTRATEDGPIEDPSRLLGMP
jgi:hypothetical protein